MEKYAIHDVYTILMKSIDCIPIPDPFEIINLRNNETVENSQRNFVFIGVMTANNFLKGRAKAVYDTWGKTVPGRIAFFSSEGSTSYGMFFTRIQQKQKA